MVEVQFGKQHGRPFLLEKNRQWLAVRSHAGKQLAHSLCCESADTALEGCELLLHVEDADVQVFKLPEHSDPAQRKALLRALPDVRFAGSVLMDPVTQEPVLYTENIFLKSSTR
jgi:hypothetical protein